LQDYEPQLIVVACGYDASSLDPLGRMMLSSEDFRQMTLSVMKAADQLCDGKLVMVHEGGYSEAYVPFCGLAVMESLLGFRTNVVDIMIESISDQQACEDHQLVQKRQIDSMADALGLPLS
jgi:acetoin utilization deacetylase AcuC-like enzyme